MCPSERVLSHSEVLVDCNLTEAPARGRFSSEVWRKPVELAKGAYTVAAEHPVETAIGAAVAAGAIYLGSTRALPRLFSQRTAVGAVIEQGELRLAAFRPHVMKPSAAALAEMELLPVSLSGSAANIEVVTCLNFLPKELRGHMIGQATFGIARADVPLTTRGLYTCGALIVQCERSGLHYLAHLDAAVAPSQIRSSLALFDLSQSRIFLMKGPHNFRVDAAVAEVLQASPGAMQRLRLVQGMVDDTGKVFGVTSYRGGLYRFSPQMRQWPGFETGQPTRRELRRLGLTVNN